jgi:hypothetical protein
MNRNLLIGITAFGVVSAATTVSALAAAPHGQARTTTAVQASLNYCSHQTGGQSRTAPAFQQCMGARGYQLASHLRAAAAATRRQVVTRQAAASWSPFHAEISVGGASSDPTPIAPSYSNQDMLNDIQRMNDTIAAAAEQNNEASAAATQNEVLFNTVYFPANN